MLKTKHHTVPVMAILVLLFGTFSSLPAQSSAEPPPGLTLARAVDAAVRNYPAIRVSQEELNASVAAIELAYHRF